MQTLENSTTPRWEFYQLTKQVALVVGCLLLWFMPFSHDICAYLDIQTYALLNQSLLYSRAWQLLWGYLNHPNETWLNIVFMVGVNVLGIYSLPKFKRSSATALMLYSWLAFQIVLLCTHKIFSDWLMIQRESPSIVMEPWLILSDALNIGDIKVYSHSSFPAGHVLVLIFWYKFIQLYSKPWVQHIALATVIVLTLPRMFSGAHWLSDVVFTIAYALVWYELAISTPIYPKVVNFFEAIIARVRNDKRIH